MLFSSLVQGTSRCYLSKSKAVSILCLGQSSKLNPCHLGKRIFTTQSRWICIEHRTTKDHRYLATNQTFLLNSYRSVFGESLKAHTNRQALREYCIAETGQDEIPDSTTIQSDFTPIYRFPYIVQARMVSRFKVYHTIFTFTLIPAAVYLNATGVVPVSAVYMFAGFFTVAGVMLVIISSFIRKIVGALYIDRKKETVKLSHLTFWSQRRDEYFKVSDIIPLSDTNEQLSDLFVKLRTFKGDSYYLTTKHGKVLEKEDFMEVVGSYSLK